MRPSGYSGKSGTGVLRAKDGFAQGSAVYACPFCAYLEALTYRLDSTRLGDSGVAAIASGLAVNTSLLELQCVVQVIGDTPTSAPLIRIAASLIHFKRSPRARQIQHEKRWHAFRGRRGVGACL